MSQVKIVAEKYFEFSNAHAFDRIASLFTSSTEYISPKTGRFVGRESIMRMMKPFHDSFTSLKWDIKDRKMIDDQTIQFRFTMTGTKKSGDSVKINGLETITVSDNKITRIEIKTI